ncbi:FAD-binding oxidoreductase [Bradyrhizobium sp. BWA-3-5]|uniref:NAD(P)/FAD-dependent oxidoreductase n=1 Tax=Bradyrhizobium sp. BWA-3-5 TaxID=3080013 RepID=UPI00293E10B8|nr:FAD-binding oxidoreductase [Bradyrhizobium sp. BWA-3-5]WOH63725.1 FAD-binding oxidoreductase [Bradyrhizobium sp. BWA-3-5]
MRNKYRSYNFPSGWNKLLPERPPASSAKGKIAAKYAVVGAGYTGLAAARRLAELDPSADIIVLESSVVGEGSSARNSGFTGGANLAKLFTGPKDMNVDSIGVSQSVSEYNGHGLSWLHELMAQHNFECDLKKSVTFRATATAEGEKLLLQQQAVALKAGNDYPLIGRDELEARTGMTHYCRALVYDTNFLLDPAKLIRGLADTLPSNVQLFERSLVSELRRAGKWVLKTAEAEVTADVVVLANNAFVKTLGWLGDKIMSLYTYAGITEAMSAEDAKKLGSEPVWGLTAAVRAGGSTLRRVGENRFMVRSLYSYEREMDPAKVRQGITEKFHRRFPKLSHVKVEHFWGCMTDMTRNGNPYWGQLDDGLFASVGYNGLGITKGTILGKRLAERILNHGNWQEVEKVYGCANKMPSEPIRAIGYKLIYTVRTRLAGVDAT